MSEENAPKLRLKPKLVANPGNLPQPPGADPSPSASEVPPAVAEEPKIVRLKPKLAGPSAPPPEPPEAFAAPVTSEPEPDFPPAVAVFPPPMANFRPPAANFPPPVAHFPPPGSAPETGKPAVKFSLKPKPLADGLPGEFPPPPLQPEAGEEFLPAGDPIPAPEFIESEEEVSRSGSPTRRVLSAKPFPAPPGEFPPPPSVAPKPTPPWAQLNRSEPPPTKKRLVVYAGGVITVLLVLGGVFFAYKKFLVETPVPAPNPRIVVQPKIKELPTQPKPETPTAAPVDKALPAAIPVPGKTAAIPVEPVPEPVKAPPPPPASAAFKAWVDTLRIGGVRGGENTRVFIGGTAYVIGDLVNPQLGIVFDSYDVEAHRLTFKDKTGATVSRRH